MASVRFRNRRYYYRVAIRDQNGRVHHIEHGGFNTGTEALEAANVAYPKKQTIPFEMTDHLVQLIFERFPEKHPAHIPLKLLYYTNCKVEEAYNIKLDDVILEEKKWIVNGKEYKLNTELYKLLQRQKKRIMDSRLIFLYPDKPEYFNIYLQTGKKIKIYQMDYIIKVIRREINPGFQIRKFHMPLDGRL